MKKSLSKSIIKTAIDGYMIPCIKNNGEIDLFARSSAGDTLLHVAAGKQDFDAIEYLLSKGLDINARGDYLATPLFNSALKRDIKTVEYLLSLGADPNIPDHRGEFPDLANFKRHKP